MIDLGRINNNLSTNVDQRILDSANSNISGRNIDNKFYSPSQPTQPVVDFGKWGDMYKQSQQVQPVQPVQQQLNPVQQQIQQVPPSQSQPVAQEIKQNDGFDFDSWLNGVNSPSMNNNQLQSQQQVQQPQKVEEPAKQQTPDINELMNRSYEVLGRQANQRGYNPQEVINMASQLSPDDIIDLYEFKKYKEQQQNVKPKPGITIVGDPGSNVNNNGSYTSIAGMGSRNVLI